MPLLVRSGFTTLALTLAVASLLAVSACSPAGSDTKPAANGGAGDSNGGRANGAGGASSDGASSGNSSSGGAVAAGGSVTSPSGGVASGNGGALQGGAGSGGVSSGGAPARGGSGGAAFGGSVNGGAGGGGAAGATSSSGGAAGATSGSGGAKASGCGAQSGLLFCDDFEKGTADAVPGGSMWTTSYIGPDAPRIVVDATSPAHSGTRSVSVTAPLGNFQSFLVYRDASVLPRASGDFYLRAWVRLNRAMADHHNTYIVLDRAASPGNGAAVRLGEQANMLSLTVGGDAHGSLSNANFSNDQVLGARFMAQTWGCLEGYFNSTKAEVDFWLNDAEIKDFHHTDWPLDAYDAVRFGFEKYAGPELTIWFDDVAIGSSRIGCQ